MKNFSERIKLLRKQKKLKQIDMAKIFNMSEKGYRNYEINKSTPHFEQLLSLADFFDVSLDYLVGRSDDPKRR